jgi:TetR/AcrR family transcriptional regulator, transcriptional repressor for nem operon
MVTSTPPRRQPAEVRREQILDAAERVLLTNGYAATTVADVADAAGLAKGTVYLQFASKNDLIAALRARYLERFLAALGSRRKNAKNRLLDVVHGLFEFSVAHHELHHVLFLEAGFSEADAFAAARRTIVDIVRAGVEAGEFHVPDVEVAGVFILHGVHGALIEAMHGHTSRTRFDKTVDALVLRVLGTT